MGQIGSGFGLIFLKFWSGFSPDFTYLGPENKVEALLSQVVLTDTMLRPQVYSPGQPLPMVVTQCALLVAVSMWDLSSVLLAILSS